MSTKKESKEVAVKEEAGLPAGISLEDDAGSGFENTTSDELSIPFIGILQKSSPELDSNDALKPGMIYDSVTEEAIPVDGNIVFYAAAYQHVFVEWIPREKGGGLVAVHDRTSDTVLTAIKANNGSSFGLTVGDHDLIETYYLYVIYQTAEGSFSQAVFPFTSSKIKPFKDWLTRARQLTLPRKSGKGKYKPPIFSIRYRMSTERRENEKGVFWVPKIGFDKNPDQTIQACLIDDAELYQQLKDFANMVEEGRAKADVSNASQEPTSDDDVPF